VETLSEIEKKINLKRDFFHYFVLLGSKHRVLLPDSRRVPQKILFYFTELL
jgi:hypothetical protein